MDPISILVVLAVMLVAIVIPGFFISLLIIDGVSPAERFCLSLVLGTFPVYISYLLIKHGLMTMNITSVLMCMFLPVVVFVVTKMRFRIRGSKVFS